MIAESLIPLVVTSSVSAIVGAIVAAVVALVRSQAQGTVDTNRALQQGMRELLWAELKSIYIEALANGGMTLADRRHLENVYWAYHTLSGNGTGTRLYEEAMALPVLKDTELD